MKKSNCKKPKKSGFKRLLKIGTLLAIAGLIMNKSKSKKMMAEAKKQAKIAKMKMACKTM